MSGHGISKRKAYGEYTKGNIYDTIRATDLLGLPWRIAGERGPTSGLGDSLEGMFSGGDAMNGSSRAREAFLELNKKYGAETAQKIYDSLSDEELEQLSTVGRNDQLRTLEQRQADIASGKWKPGVGQSGYVDPMEALIEELRKPIDPNEPMTKALLAQTSNAAQQDAANRGVQGGLAGANTQQAYVNAQAGMNADRQRLLQSALGQQHGQQMDFVQMSQAANAQARARQVEQGQMIGGLGGTIIGGMYGGAAGAQMGGQMGGQFVGGLYSQGYTNRTYRPEEYGYGARSRGLSPRYGAYRGGNF